MVKRRCQAQAFDGEGARALGGRWNSVGTPVVYCSESLALAALEILVHVGAGGVLLGYVAIPIRFPERIVEAVKTERLPRGWRDHPPLPALHAVGDAWVREGRSAVLRLPSVVVDAEANYVLNPNHADFAKIEIGRARVFRLDPRLSST